MEFFIRPANTPVGRALTARLLIDAVKIQRMPTCLEFASPFAVQKAHNSQGF